MLLGLALKYFSVGRLQRLRVLSDARDLVRYRGLEGGVCCLNCG